ncbi:MAG: hemL [Bacteriovoracaceae bacterium]|nr:hemL [Bacteriovoracaceae bacterium]
MIFEKSEAILNRARRVTPGGVSSPVRSFKHVGGNAFVAKHGDGAYLFDVDGNKYIDLVCSWGALIHGHNHPRIRTAIEQVLQSGTSFGITSEKEVELCELLTKSVAGLQMVRLVNSGTEACMSALRLARGATKRDLIIKFDGCYHGHGDSFLVGAGSGVASLPVSESAGVTEKTLEDTIVLPFNDVEALEATFKARDGEIAGAILEVVCGNIGVIAPEPEFLSALRSLTQKSKSILIFDEVMTGFRLSLSGAQNLYGISPDLICLGKIIGGGLPVGAYGGRADLMEHIAPLGSVYQAGTLSGNPLGCAAGIASLELILENEKFFYQALDAYGSEWKSQMDSHIASKGYAASVAQIGSMISVFFTPDLPRNYADVKTADKGRFKKFFWALMKQGVYYPPSPFEACFLSIAHDHEIMEKVTEASFLALDEAFRDG